MTIKADFTLWILTRTLTPPDDEELYYGRILTLRFLVGYIVSLLSIYYLWNFQGFKSSRQAVKLFLGYVIFLILLSLYVMDTEQLYSTYWYKEHLGKLIVLYKISGVVLDLFTMQQCLLPEIREDIRLIGGIAALSYSLDFIEILLIWFHVTI